MRTAHFVQILGFHAWKSFFCSPERKQIALVPAGGAAALSVKVAYLYESYHFLSQSYLSLRLIFYDVEVFDFCPSLVHYMAVFNLL